MNDGMGNYVAHEVVKLMIQKDIRIKNGKVLILGITFKENCPDIRNSKVIDVIQELENYNLDVDVYDPWAQADEVKHEFNRELITDAHNLKNDYDAVILAVAHAAFREMDLSDLLNGKSVVFDVKAFLDESLIDGRL